MERKSEAQAARFGGTAGQPLDPCYHQACDTVENVNLEVLQEMTGALLHALEALERSADGFVKRGPSPTR